MADKNFLLLKKLMYVCSNKSFILRKMILAAVLLLIFPAALFAKGITLTDHTKIKELSTFRVTGEYELRTQKSPKSEVKFCTLNHEGGMEVRVLEIFEKSEYKGKTGLWLYVLLTKPIWASSGQWIEKYQNFLIFLPDQTPVFDFEE